jgi:hypothetical protein
MNTVIMWQLMRTARTPEAKQSEVLQGSVITVTKVYESCTEHVFGCWISPCYGPLSLGAHFETYELFLSLIFTFFLGRTKPWITEIVDTGSVEWGACLYMRVVSLAIQCCYCQLPIDTQPK